VQPPSETARLFRRALLEWLKRNGLDHDCSMYAADEWAMRGEEFLCSAEFVLVTEGGLSCLLNYSSDHAKIGELQELCSSFGYWYELGNTWSVGFYRDDEPLKPWDSRRYSELLQDPRWKAKADRVRARAKGQCEDCGSKAPLEVHHCWYRYGLAPWQYPDDCLRAVCRDCHVTRDPIEQHIRGTMARLTHAELSLLRKAVDSLFHWYDREAARAFLKSIGPDEQAMRNAVDTLAENKTEPGADI
jgi:5-methylcytosine-specific restriction endonuclease McrA